MTDALKDMTVAELLEYQEALGYRGHQLKQDLEAWQGELHRRFGSVADASAQRALKASGTLTDPIGGGFRLKHKRDKVVEWDTDKLMAWAQGTSWETVQHNSRVTFEVKESVYKALQPDSELKKTFADARTERYRPTKYEILPPSGN